MPPSSPSQPNSPHSAGPSDHFPSTPQEVLAYSNSSAQGRAFLKHLTDLSIRGTLFVPQNSRLMEKKVSGVRGACTFRRDVLYQHHSVSQITPAHESACLSFTGEVTVQDPVRAKQQSLPQIQRGTVPHQHTQMWSSCYCRSQQPVAPADLLAALPCRFSETSRLNRPQQGARVLHANLHCWCRSVLWSCLLTRHQPTGHKAEPKVRVGNKGPEARIRGRKRNRALVQ